MSVLLGGSLHLSCAGDWCWIWQQRSKTFIYAWNRKQQYKHPQVICLVQFP